MPAVISARGLVKKYGDLVAVDHIDLQIEKGEVFGFLGPNGAGKSTTMHIIQGTSPLTAGRLEVLGMDITARAKEVKALIGVAPQENNLDPDFTGLRNLTSYARYFSIPPAQAKKRALELLDMMQLTEKKDTAFEQLSGCMKRRLFMARALINDPQLLILDEPTTGLDPQARHLIWEKIRDLQQRGTTIILTTHYMDEAEQLCDRLVIMEKGKILLEGGPRALIEEQVGSCVMEVIDPPGQGIEDYLATTGGQVERSADRIYLYSRQCQVIQSEFRGRFPDVYSTVRPSTLEDVYLKLTGRRLRD